MYVYDLNLAKRLFKGLKITSFDGGSLSVEFGTRRTYVHEVVTFPLGYSVTTLCLMWQVSSNYERDVGGSRKA